jgi:ferredoxin
MSFHLIVRALAGITAAGIALALIGAAVISWREGERRAARRLSVLGVLLPLPYALTALITGAEIAAAALIGLTGAAGVLLLVPVGRTSDLDDTPTHRIDERDIMFARARLQPGTARFDEYYRRNPAHRTADDRFRAKPGLLSPGASLYNPVQFAAAESSFTAVSAFHALLDHAPAAGPVAVDPAAMTRFIGWWAKKLGAVSAGITELRDYHVYSHLGRNEPYGAPVDLDHRFAIAFTVEMDRPMLEHAPHGPTVMESAQQYLNAGAIAIQIALLIQSLGYPARAHLDGNYRVVCPLVARDAGLGEIGRMGLLMTPELGPRVRLGVVTTDLPLITTPRRRDPSVIDFCTRCKKCAVVCPSRAIPFDDRQDIDGVSRWQIDSAACFTYWCTVGTDCGRCVRACPYAHPSNALHDVVRWGVRRSSLFRVVAVRLDDWLYGRNPAPVPPPAWMKPSIQVD